MQTQSGHPLIAIDWGSTHLRAKLVIDGAAVDQVASADGIRNRRGRDFDDILQSQCGRWRKKFPGIPVMMSGMIGSREGWAEVPYVTTPTGVADLAGALATVSSRHFDTVTIVPGVRFDPPGGDTTDVMRGEETQVSGVLAARPETGVVTICLPGTHSKWVVCRDRRIEAFRTWLTGEAFERLTSDSLLCGEGGGIVDPACAAFARGLELSATDGGLLHHLFLGRTEMLTGRVAAADLRGLISGLLLGHEIREARKFARGPLFLVGDSPAAKATARALEYFDLACEHITDHDVHLAGLLAIRAAAQTSDGEN